MKKIKVLILPEIGTDVISDHWYPWVSNELAAIESVEVVTKQMPDTTRGKEAIWLPHIKNQLQVNKDFILIGHSVGGAAALRFVEEYPIFGLILVSVGLTDLGTPERTESGYYSRSWNWSNIAKNTNWIVQFASQDDTSVPINEARMLHLSLNTEYHEYTDRGHFGSEYRMEKEFPELLEVIRRKLFIDG